MTEGQGPGAGRFAAELRALYTAAGSPTLDAVCRQAKKQQPPVKIADSTLSAWLKGDNVPANRRTALFVSEHLTDLARRRDRAFPPYRADYWATLHRDASEERRAGRGRGGRPASGARVPGQRAADSDAVPRCMGTVRTTYSHQVKQIFPGELLDRDRELADLAEFATCADGRAYSWWQGRAWTGKSALMASFALDPPPQVHVVSFFITARFAGQSDRAAFLEAVLGQLSELLGESLPNTLTESAQQRWFLKLIEQAAESCRQCGHRLVLIVDGLDEDRGITESHTSRSIAALLPADPPEGVRIIVAGRPDPPVPSAVPSWHPLNDPRIVRPLAQSEHAIVMRGDAQRDLGELLDQGGLGRQLLGLVVAAGGGLSGEDLAEITGEPVGDTERVLHAVTGRPFTRRDQQWGTPGHVYVLAHEELQLLALRALRTEELARWRNAIHHWAERYQQAGWPSGTPEYLLRGYMRMLLAAKELSRMQSLATDIARLDRMLNVSGGDGAALADITTIQEFIRDETNPDLDSSVHLALTRRRLINRNSNMPQHLPAAWATLGNTARAEALARSVADPSARVEALALAAEAVAKRGDLDLSRSLASQAEASARLIPAFSGQASALASVSIASANSGDLARAEAIAFSIASPCERVQALAGVAEAAAAGGDLNRARPLAEQAEAISHSVAEFGLASAAGAIARSGDLDRAESIAFSITDLGERAWALAMVAEAAVTNGNSDRAGSLAIWAEDTARSVDNPVSQASALAAVVGAVVNSGDPHSAQLLVDEAEDVARSVDDPAEQAEALVSATRAAASGGDLDRAEAVARSITNSHDQSYALASLVTAAAESGDLKRAEALIGSIASPYCRACSLISVAEAITRDGDLERARSLVGQAEVLARSIVDLDDQATALTSIIETLAVSGDLERARSLVGQAEAVARSVPGPDEAVTRVVRFSPHPKADALLSLAKLVTRMGDLDRAQRLTDLAEVVTRSISDSDFQPQELIEVAKAIAQNGDFEHAMRVIGSIARSGMRDWGLAAITEVMAKSGDLTGAEDAVYSINDRDARSKAMAAIAEALALNGDFDGAEAIAAGITDSVARSRALAAIAEAIAVSRGDLGRARGLAGQAEAAARILSWEIALTTVAVAFARCGDVDRAVSIIINQPEANNYPDDNLTRNVHGLTSLAKAVAELGDLSRARSLVSQAETMAHSIINQDSQARALASVAEAAAKTGDVGAAQRLLAAALISVDPVSVLQTLAAIDFQAVESFIAYWLGTAG